MFAAAAAAFCTGPLAAYRRGQAKEETRRSAQEVGGFDFHRLYRLLRLLRDQRLQNNASRLAAVRAEPDLPMAAASERAN